MGRKKWTKESLSSAFVQYAESGGNIRASALKKERADLYGSILYHFKSYPRFFESIGYDYKSIHGKRFWTNEEVIQEFKKYEAEFGDISPKQLHTQRLDLYGQIEYKFGSYKTFVDSLGYDYKSICKRRSWTSEEVIDAIKQRSDNGLSLLSIDLLSDYFALYRACCSLFGSYKSALEKAGIDYLSHVGDFHIASAFGFEFESLLDRMFTALGKTYKRHSKHVEGIVPDFYVEENNVFIDAKLSSWTVFYSDTIEKYTPHCSKLVVVYLRGPEIKREINGVEFRHVSYYFEELERAGLSAFILEFEELLTRLTVRTAEVA